MKNYKIYTMAFLILGFTACSSTYDKAQIRPLSSVDNKSEDRESEKSNFEITGEATVFMENNF